MSRTRPMTFVAGVLVATYMLTGCGAGQVTSTATQVSNSVGGNAAVGTIAVRDAVIVFGETVEGGFVHPRGEDAPLAMTIINEGGDVDRLVSASSPVAESVEITGATDIPGGRAVVVEGEAATPAPAPASPAPAGPAPATPTRAASPSAAPGTAEGVTLVLTGLREDIRAGISYPVTLMFERAGALTVDVPVGNTDEAREAAEGEE